MTLLPFARRRTAPGSDTLPRFLTDASIEVMPRTLAKIEDLQALLPKGTRVYLAHISGTTIDDMIAAATRLAREGYEVVPHIPARLIPDSASLHDWTRRYRDAADARAALVLAGGIAEPIGPFDSSMQLLESGAFDAAGFTRLHVAGHPEGNRDIDPDGSDRAVMEALHWKQAFSERSDAAMALVTQFTFEAAPIIAWAERLRAEGIILPIHVGLAGPAKLQTLIKFAIACGVGPSLKVLQKRAMDVTKLLLPYTPDDVAAALAAHCAAEPQSLIRQAHLFPLGGIGPSAEWLASRRAPMLHRSNAL